VRCGVCALVCVFLYACVLYVYASISLALSRSLARARSLSFCKCKNACRAHVHTLAHTHDTPEAPSPQPSTPNPKILILNSQTRAGRHPGVHAILFHFTTPTHYSHFTTHAYCSHFTTRRETSSRKCPTPYSSDPKTWRPPGCVRSSRRFRSQSKCRCTQKKARCRMRFIKKGKLEYVVRVVEIWGPLFCLRSLLAPLPLPEKCRFRV